MRWSLVIAVLLAAPLPGMAQDVAAPETRVRVIGSDGTVAVGMLQELTADSIRIVDATQRTLTLAREGMMLERSLGRKTKFWKHFGIATAAVATGGALISALTWNECSSCWIYPESRPEAFAWGFAAGAAVGVPVGIIAGLAIKVERWEPLAVPIRGSAAPSHAPSSRPFALTVSLPLP